MQEGPGFLGPGVFLHVLEWEPSGESCFSYTGNQPISVSDSMMDHWKYIPVS